MGKEAAITKPQLQRYPIYLKLLQELKEEGVTRVSSSMIACRLGNSEEQVRKDFQAIAHTQGKPGLGRDVSAMIATLEEFLGYRDSTDAVLIGVGHLGDAFLRYEGFAALGIDIRAGFDVDPSKVGQLIGGKRVLPMEELEGFLTRTHTRLAILTVPASSALEVAERLKKCGIQGIWNFAPVHLDYGEDVIVENVDLASSLAILSHQMKNQF